jgi:predicted Zn-dependent peptidase
MSAGGNRSYVTISGLSQNMEQAMLLYEDIVKTLKPNKEALDNLVKDVLKSREDVKQSQNTIMGQLVTYGYYGGVNSPVKHTTLSEKELRAMKPEMLIAKVQDWMKYKQFVIYYGPNKQESVVASVNKTHNLDNLKDVPAEKLFKEDVPKETRIYLVDYDAPQTIYYGISFGGNYQPELSAKMNVYNAYFGSGMNAIVFQELREARALAYTAYSMYRAPGRKEELYSNINVIQCGNDKLKESIKAFADLVNNMPENETSFNIAKESVLSNYRTARTRKDQIVWTYLKWQRLGLTEDPRKNNYATTPSVTLADVKQFQKEYVAGKPQTIVILGEVDNMDMDYLNTLGKVKVLSLKDIFGY